MKPAAFFTFLPLTLDHQLAERRTMLAMHQGLEITTWHSAVSTYIYQRIDADDEAALTFFLLSVPMESS